MPLPAALNLIPLHGRILRTDATGTPATGTVSFRCETTLRDTTDNVLLAPTTLTATLDASGAFTISLPATDDPDVTPSGWTYVVTITTDALHDSFRIAVPAATVGTLELADIAPAVPPSTLVTYVLASRIGQANGVAALGADGLVPTSQLPTGSGGTGPSPATTVTDETTYGVAKAVGASALYARGDHTHGSPAAPTAVSVGADVAGAATTAVSGHAVASDPHGDRGYTDTAVAAKPSLTSSAATSSAVGDTAAAGTATTAARGDHRHAREAFGNVTAQTTAGMASSNGSATTVARSDHAHGTPAAGGGTASVHKSTGFITTGDVSATGAAFAQIGTDLTITAATGDVLLLHPEILCLAGSDTQFEAATRVSSADANYWSSGTGTSRWPGGLAGWYCEAGNLSMGTTGRYTVQAGDIVAGSVTVRFYARSTGAARTVKADTNYPTRWSLTNIGPDS